MQNWFECFFDPLSLHWKQLSTQQEVNALEGGIEVKLHFVTFRGCSRPFRLLQSVLRFAMVAMTDEPQSYESPPASPSTPGIQWVPLKVPARRRLQTLSVFAWTALLPLSVACFLLLWSVFYPSFRHSSAFAPTGPAIISWTGRDARGSCATRNDTC